MARMIAIILALLLLFTGCELSQSNQAALEFYYPVTAAKYTKGASYLQAEMRDGTSLSEDLIVILNTYLKGPNDDASYQNPFQANTQVLSIQEEGTVLNITLSRNFASLRGLELTVACASLSMTCLALTDADVIRIHANGSSFDGVQYIEMRLDNLLLYTQEGAINKP